MAKNRSPAFASRESVQTAFTSASAAPPMISAPQASAINFNERISTIFYFNKNVAVTTAVIVFWRELVSLSPCQLVATLCSDVI